MTDDSDPHNLHRSLCAVRYLRTFITITQVPIGTQYDSAYLLLLNSHWLKTETRVSSASVSKLEFEI